ncbi:TPA: hypothetical protein HA239_00820 [Candidatus Woesearchaeota archaeon]|nr:hypothetical protein QT06_C0001G0202 [archaeon GW2011_AR15]MBS3103996.1 hypothetical protein [Candidatus Woesearchaeota archaeon]HIH40936.1 hypothetical protein [Candidatus Woesearchaeota archaeon]
MRKKNGNAIAMIWLIFAQLFMLITLLPWFAVFGPSFMVFDKQNPILSALYVGAVGSYPVVCILLSIFAWKAYAEDKIRKAVVLGSIPIVIAIIFMLLII